MIENQSNFALSGIKGLSRLFIPLLLISFSNFVFLLVEKSLLARLSVEYMEAAVSTAYICQVFKLPTVAIAMMTQVYVGRWLGADQTDQVGRGVWQMIWLALLSMIVTVPGSLAYGSYYFSGSDLEEIARPYFYLDVAMNFLYPLLATLSCFYIAIKKDYFYFFSMLVSQLIKLVLGYILIMGIEGWFPSLGIIGGAISTFVAQGGICLFLLLVFLNSHYSKKYNTRDWKFRPSLLWECFHPGFLRALSRILSTFSWASISHLMICRGGDYSLVLSVGGTLFLFLPFVSEALLQAQLTVMSYIIGAKDYHLMARAFRSGLILTFITIGFVGIPLVGLPMPIFDYLFGSIPMSEHAIRNIFFGVWASFAFFTIAYVPISFVLAFKDTKFSLFMGGVSWINGYLLMYAVMEFIGIESYNFWIALTLTQSSTYVFYDLRMRYLRYKALKETMVPLPAYS